MTIYRVLSCTRLLFRFSYLLVPLYDLYCQTTGLGGTLNIKTRKEIPNQTDKFITIDFQSHVQEGFPIEFKSNLSNITTTLGKPTLVFYTAKNLTNETLYGIRTYNVTPRKSAQFFHKLECFCFDEQRLKPNEIVEMPILFYIDPEITEHNGNDIKLISINYTFYPSRI